MTNEVRGHAMMNVEGKRNTVRMEVWVDGSCLVREIGTMVGCGQGGVRRKLE